MEQGSRSHSQGLSTCGMAPQNIIVIIIIIIIIIAIITIIIDFMVVCTRAPKISVLNQMNQIPRIDTYFFKFRCAGGMEPTGFIGNRVTSV